MNKLKSEKSICDIAIRRDIHSLSKEEQLRFFRAAKQMLKSKEGKRGTSEFYRIGKIHGFPLEKGRTSIWCAHGIITFPAWHRAYVLEFEKALQKADKEINPEYKDSIALPYWDWTDFSTKKDYFPQILRDWKVGDYPDDFYEDDEFKALMEKDHIKERLPDQEYRERAELQKLDELALSIFNYPHKTWSHNSYKGEPGSIENPHNFMHNLIGPPMNQHEYAGYDLAFWLHHSNVDRFIQARLKQDFNCGKDTNIEFEMDNPELFSKKLEPFKNDLTGTDFYPVDCYIEDTSKLGYTYDVLPQPNTLLERPRQPKSIFNIRIPIDNIYDLNIKFLSLFIKKKGVEIEIPNVYDYKKWILNENYVGIDAVFVANTRICSNCSNKQIVSFQFDTTQTLSKLNLKEEDAEGIVAFLDRNNNVIVPKEESFFKLKDFGFLTDLGLFDLL